MCWASWTILKAKFGQFAWLAGVVFLQFQVILGTMTIIVTARGEGNPSLPSVVAKEQPSVFWTCMLGAILVNNVLFSFWIKARERAKRGEKLNHD